MSTFETIFHSSEPDRDKFLSRIFGIFNEDMVRCWCSDPRSPFEDIGRPTITPHQAPRGYTLDFTLRSRETGKIYVGEMKCELEYQNYRYLTLESSSQLEHHAKEAFRLFLDAATSPNRHRVTTRGQPQTINGAVLVWGRCTEAGRSSVIKEYGLHAILSLEEIIGDLITWRNECFAELLNQRANWCNELFNGLRRIAAL